MSRILSEDEIRALLRGVADGALGAGGDTSAGGAARAVRSLDLTGGERSLRGRMPGLERVVERFARGLRPALGAFCGRLPRIAPGGLELRRFERVAARLAQPAGVQLFRMPPLAGHGLLVVTPELVSMLVQVCCGGRPGRQAAIAGRELSAIEQRVLERIGGRVLQELRDAWRPLEKVEFAGLGSETSPLLAAIAAPQDLVVLIDLRVEVDGSEAAELSICIPDASLDPLRARLQGELPREGGPAAGGWVDRWRAALGEAELELAAELGTHRMRLDEVLGLRVGDVITLGTGRDGPVVVRVEGRSRFLAAPGVSGGSNAVRVTARV